MFDLIFLFVEESLMGPVSLTSSKIASAFICFDISSGGGFSIDSCCVRGALKNFLILGSSSSESSPTSLAEPHQMLSSTSSSSTSSHGSGSAFGWLFVFAFRANDCSRCIIVRLSVLFRSRLCSFSARSAVRMLPKEPALRGASRIWVFFF